MFKPSDYGRSFPSVGRGGAPPANPGGAITFNIPSAEDLSNLIGSVLVLFPMMQDYIDALGVTMNDPTNASDAMPSVYALRSDALPATGNSNAVELVRTLTAMVRERSNVVVGANELSAVLQWLNRQRNQQ